MRCIDSVGARAASFALASASSLILLVCGELLWLDSVPLTPTHVAVLLALVIPGLAIIEALVAFAASSLRRSLPHRWPVAVAALSLPFTAWAASSLLSGGWVSTVRGVFWFKTALALLFAALVALTPVYFGRLRSSPHRNWIALALAGACLSSSYLDTHFLVGLYPALHYLLAALSVALAIAASKLVASGVERSKRYAFHVLAALTVVSLAVTASTWRSVPAMNLAANANGLYPKLRATVGRSAELFAADRAATDGDDSVRDPSQAYGFVATTGHAMERIRSRAKNVIFILTDALRNDFVGRTEGRLELMPFWSKWREQTVRFTIAYSPSDHTGRSMSALMTSYPWPVVDAVAGLQTPLRTWMNLLREQSLRTFANGHCHYVKLRYSYIPIERCMGAETIKPGVELDMVADIAEFVAEAPHKPFAIYTHWMDTHLAPGPELPRAYAAAVTQIDQRLERLIAELERLNVYGETLIVWTADHGYSLGEGHRFSGLHGVVERQVRVPLVLHIPGFEPPSHVNDTPVSGLQIAPTIIDVLAPSAEWLVGAASLMPLVLGREPEARALERDWSKGIYSTTGGQHMLRDGAYKLIARTTEQSSLIYDVRADPEEKVPLEDAELAERMVRLLGDERKRHQRLTLALTSHGPDGIAPEVAAVVAQKKPDAARLRALVDQVERYDEPTRVALLEYLAKHQLPVGNELWERYQRGPLRGDQRVLVVSAVGGSREACRQLGREWNPRQNAARHWLGELFEVLPRKCAKQLRARALEDVLKLAERGFDFSTREHRSEAALVHGLAMQYRRRAPAELKELLLQVHLELRRSLRLSTYATILYPRFSETMLVGAMQRTYDAADLPLLERVPVGSKTVRPLIAMVGRVETAEGKRILWKILDRAAKRPSAAAGASRALRRLSRGKLRREALTYLEARAAAAPPAP